MEWLRAAVPVFVSVPPAGVQVTAYPVIGLPPVFAGAKKLTLPVVAPVEPLVTLVGGWGATALTVNESGPTDGAARKPEPPD